MATDADCIFCKIIAGEIPSERVHEDDQTYVFMDIRPGNRGHALVIPKNHTQDLTTIEPADLSACAIRAQDIARRAKDKLGASGVNLLNCCGADAWQTVFHFHLHVVPRYPDDSLQLPWIPAPGDPEQIAQAAQQLRS